MIVILFKIFIVFFRIGLFAIGGAYSFLPLIEKEVVERFNWLTKEEFLDVLGLVNIFPGAISIKYATYTGYKLAGVPGALVANLGNLLSPCLLIIFASVVYYKYKDYAQVKGAFNMIQLTMVAMIIAVAFQLVNINQIMQFKNIFVIVVSFVLFTYTKIHPALIIISAGIIGAVIK